MSVEVDDRDAPMRGIGGVESKAHVRAVFQGKDTAGLAVVIEYLHPLRVERELLPIDLKCSAADTHRFERAPVHAGVATGGRGPRCAVR